MPSPSFAAPGGFGGGFGGDFPSFGSFAGLRGAPSFGFGGLPSFSFGSTPGRTHLPFDLAAQAGGAQPAALPAVVGTRASGGPSLSPFSFEGGESFPGAEVSFGLPGAGLGLPAGLFPALGGVASRASFVGGHGEAGPGAVGAGFDFPSFAFAGPQGFGATPGFAGAQGFGATPGFAGLQAGPQGFGATPGFAGLQAGPQGFFAGGAPATGVAPGFSAQGFGAFPAAEETAFGAPSRLVGRGAPALTPGGLAEQTSGFAERLDGAVALNARPAGMGLAAPRGGGVLADASGLLGSYGLGSPELVATGGGAAPFGAAPFGAAPFGAAPFGAAPFGAAPSAAGAAQGQGGAPAFRAPRALRQMGMPWIAGGDGRVPAELPVGLEGDSTAGGELVPDRSPTSLAAGPAAGAFVLPGVGAGGGSSGFSGGFAGGDALAPFLGARGLRFPSQLLGAAARGALPAFGAGGQRAGLAPGGLSLRGGAGGARSPRAAAGQAARGEARGQSARGQSARGASVSLASVLATPGADLSRHLMGGRSSGVAGALALGSYDRAALAQGGGAPALRSGWQGLAARELGLPAAGLDGVFAQRLGAQGPRSVLDLVDGGAAQRIVPGLDAFASAGGAIGGAGGAPNGFAQGGRGVDLTLVGRSDAAGGGGLSPFGAAGFGAAGGAAPGFSPFGTGPGWRGLAQAQLDARSPVFSYDESGLGAASAGPGLPREVLAQRLSQSRAQGRRARLSPQGERALVRALGQQSATAGSTAGAETWRGPVAGAGTLAERSAPRPVGGATVTGAQARGRQALPGWLPGLGPAALGLRGPAALGSTGQRTGLLADRVAGRAGGAPAMGEAWGGAQAPALAQTGAAAPAPGASPALVAPYMPRPDGYAQALGAGDMEHTNLVAGPGLAAPTRPAGAAAPRGQEVLYKRAADVDPGGADQQGQSPSQDVSRESAHVATPPQDLSLLVNQLYAQIKRELLIERERRGLMS
ncbi:MAG: hypothetical protein AB7T09_33710 [Planctomycetota bacterium]